jgi:hypothetical protein
MIEPIKATLYKPNTLWKVILSILDHSVAFSLSIIIMTNAIIIFIAIASLTQKLALFLP